MAINRETTIKSHKRKKKKRAEFKGSGETGGFVIGKPFCVGGCDSLACVTSTWAGNLDQLPLCVH